MIFDPEQRKLEREVRAQVQPGAEKRVPKHCRNKDNCPLQDAPPLGQSMPSVCVQVCGAHRVGEGWE